MSDKKLLIILILLAIYIFFVNPLNSKLKMKMFELRNIEKYIAKEKFIENKAKEIKKTYPQAMQKIRKNQQLFFPENISTSSAMSYMQKTIKNLALKEGLNIINMHWGVAENKNNYDSLPISFTMKGYPNQIFLFIKDILSLKKLIKFNIYSTSAYRDKILIRAVVSGFKIKKENQKGLGQ